GSTILGTGTLDSAGQAMFTTSTLAVGSHSITASYGGDANFNGSTSPRITQSVKYGTTTSVSSSLNPSVFGQSVKVTATVTANSRPGNGSPVCPGGYRRPHRRLSDPLLDVGPVHLGTASDLARMADGLATHAFRSPVRSPVSHGCGSTSTTRAGVEARTCSRRFFDSPDCIG